VLAKSASNQRPSLWGQFHLAHPAVARVIIARDEPLFYQAIDGHADGTGRQPDFGPNGVHWERTLMEEDFQDAEIGVAQQCPLDALLRVRDQRLKGFHENEPDMNASGVLPRGCFFSPHFDFNLDMNYIDINIMYIKQTKLT